MSYFRWLYVTIASLVGFMRLLGDRAKKSTVSTQRAQ